MVIDKKWIMLKDGKVIEAGPCMIERRDRWRSRAAAKPMKASALYQVRYKLNRRRAKLSYL